VESELVEQGDVIAGNTPGRTSDGQITVADLTGVAVQDIKIATAVYEYTLRMGVAQRSRRVPNAPRRLPLKLDCSQFLT
jgi:ornithine cyclodeaminase/alanine dehydrogenase-like protein (mu-crystallin family)